MPTCWRSRAVRCEEFVARLPQSWPTRLGEIGGRLSGRERQRISIARAPLKNASIVCLDEPTAALDVEGELAVQQAVGVPVRERTVIVIAHRPPTSVGADRIFVIDGGRLVQQGRHEPPPRAGGRHRAMWMAQRRASAHASRLGGGAVQGGGSEQRAGGCRDDRAMPAAARPRRRRVRAAARAAGAAGTIPRQAMFSSDG
ncbi:ATP-binding cassette domain-containing protein [Burkholderia plantarii]|uniref:Putative ABC-transporter ATP binding protein n=1 Tax=Burkholderia plantarii TaxID=41899 RepID=A0A0B6S3N2_BURPL|nr:ATP-binding cassette domain-containing protein [Burkholderia plantarii]AJK49024.1 putative ABC-transporter ATP binding protein [Burkholderia plantarii]